MSLNGTSV